MSERQEPRLGAARAAERSRGAPRALVAGSLTRERIETRVADRWCIGGVSWYGATTLAKLGIETRVVARTARADRDLARHLRRREVAVAWEEAARTTVFVNAYGKPAEPDRTQRVEGVAEPIRSACLGRWMQGADLVYLGPLHPHDLSPDCLALFSRRPRPLLALDIQGYVRVIEDGRVRPGVHSLLHRWLTRCDAMKASVAEALLIADGRDPRGLACELSARYPSLEVVITDGAQGAWCGRDDEMHFEPAVAVDVEDVTGAGDVYFAAYLAGRLAGLSVSKASARAAATVGANLIDPERTVTLPDDAQATRTSVGRRRSGSYRPAWY